MFFHKKKDFIVLGTSHLLVTHQATPSKRPMARHLADATALLGQRKAARRSTAPVALQPCCGMLHRTGMTRMTKYRGLSHPINLHVPFFCVLADIFLGVWI